MSVEDRDIPLLNSRTCRLMYLRNASDFQRPTSIIMYSGVSSMNIAIAAADLLDWIPMSSDPYPKTSFPMAVALARNASRMSYWLNSSNLPFDKYVHIGESSDAPG